MALPTTILNLSLTIPSIGPFKALGSIASYTGDTTLVFNFGGDTTAGAPGPMVAQTFVSTGGLVKQVKVSLLKVASPADNVYMELRDGSPTGTLLATSDSVSGSSLTTVSGSKVDFVFSTSTTLVNGSTYAWVLQRSGALDNTNYYSIGGALSDAYASGTAFNGLTSSRTNFTAQATRDLYFIVSIDAYYVLGVSVPQPTFICMQSSDDPTANFTRFNTGSGITYEFTSETVLRVAGYQVGYILHILVGTQPTATNTVYYYITFDTSTETFGTHESVQASVNASTSGAIALYDCSLVVRSDGVVVALFQGAQVASMGSSYSRISYKKRTALGVWDAAATAVDAGGTSDFRLPEAVLGASDSIHFLFDDQAALNQNQRTLNSSNVLQTVGTVAVNLFNAIQSAVSYVRSGVTKVVFGRSQSSAVIYFDSGNTPTLNLFAFGITISSNPRGFVDGTDVYFIGVNGATTTISVQKSTDNGATWGAAVTALVGTAIDALAHDGAIYNRSGAIIIPYVFNDNGTLKYNEFQIATAGVLSAVATAGGTPIGTSYASESIRPDADSSDGSWVNELGTNTNLFASIDEAVVSDADYIQSGIDPVADVVKIGFGNPSGTLLLDPVSVSYRYRKDSSATASLVVRLKQGVTTIATFTHSGISADWVTATQLLTAPQIASISDFTDLYLEFQGDNS